MKRNSLYVGVAAAALLATTAAPLAAQAQDPNPTPNPSQSAENLTPREKEVARRAGVNPVEAEKQTRDNMTMLSDSTAWVVIDDVQSGQTNRSVDIDAGICSGRFYPIRVVKNVLEWGAENSCASTAAPNDLYPHSISATLRQGNVGKLSIRLYDKATVSSPKSSAYSRVASTHGMRKCADNNTHKFVQVVNITVHGTKFGPKSSPEVRFACGV